MGVRRPTAENLRTRPRDSSKHAGPKLQTADILLFCISYAALGREKGQAPAAHAKFKRKIKPPVGFGRALVLAVLLSILAILVGPTTFGCDPEGGFGGRRPRSASQAKSHAGNLTQRYQHLMKPEFRHGGAPGGPGPRTRAPRAPHSPRAVGGECSSFSVALPRRGGGCRWPEGYRTRRAGLEWRTSRPRMVGLPTDPLPRIGAFMAVMGNHVQGGTKRVACARLLHVYRGSKKGHEQRW